MLWESKLGEKLVAARKRRGWSLAEATRRMEPHVLENTLRTLEGLNPQRAPADGGEMKMKTAIATMTAYWPDIDIRDFVSDCLLRVVPRPGRYRSRLKHLAKGNGGEA
jgi:hypothetical protein